MSPRIPVFLYATDPVCQAGVASQLRLRPSILVVDEEQVDDALVAVVVTDEIDDAALRAVRAIQRNGVPRVVVIAAQLDEVGLVAAIEAGVCAFLRRGEATPECLEHAVLAAANGDGSVPPDLLGRLLNQVGRLQRQVLAPRGLSFSGLAARELDVLRLVADGLDTAEIAKRLAYSERTVKNVIHDVTTRLQLRNRSHAVAYAVRQGLI